MAEKQRESKPFDADHPPVTTPSRIDRLKQIGAEFSAAGIQDLAAGLTYYTVLSVFPLLIALVSVLKMVGGSEEAMPVINDFISQTIPDESMATTINGIIEGFLDSRGAGIGLVIGLLVALWSASNYVGAFTRAANKLYSVTDSRNAIKLKATQLIVTICLLIVVLAMIATMAANPVISAIGDVFGGGDDFTAIWGWVRWPVVLVLIMVMVSLLFRFAPDANAKSKGIFSVGSIAAVIIAIIAVAGFGIYVSGFSSYEKTYGALAGVVIALLLIWIINLALLTGVFIDVLRKEKVELP